MPETKTHKTRVEIEPVAPPDNLGSLTDWLEKQLIDGREFMLAHFDDGLVWGRLGPSKGFITSHELAPALSPPLLLTTLQQAFVFGEHSEVRLWRGEVEGWEARLIKERKAPKFNAEKAQAGHCFDEDQLLWGTKVVNSFSEGFTHVLERQQHGMEHVVPIPVDDKQLNDRLLRLRVRHFINHDEETGEARIYLSRLVKVFVSLGEDR